MAQSCGRQSLRPLACFILASGGKLMMAIGAAELVGGRLDHNASTTGIGGALLGTGLAAAVSAAVLFAADVKRVAHLWGWVLKLASISAALAIASGYGLRAYGQHTKSVAMERGALGPLVYGLGTMTFVLPRFFTYSEAVHGMVLRRYRRQVQQAAEITGFPTLASFSILGAAGHFSTATAMAVNTLSAMGVLLGFAIARSDRMHEQLLGVQSHAEPFSPAP